MLPYFGLRPYYTTNRGWTQYTPGPRRTDVQTQHPAHHHRSAASQHARCRQPQDPDAQPGPPGRRGHVLPPCLLQQPGLLPLPLDDHHRVVSRLARLLDDRRQAAGRRAHHWRPFSGTRLQRDPGRQTDSIRTCTARGNCDKAWPATMGWSA
jgi:hypothetical protein